MSGVRFAIRSLRSSPGFTLTAIATLALGIGATTAIYSVVYAVLLRPLPFPAPEQIVGIWAWQSGPGSQSQTGATYEAAQALAASPAFTAVAWEEGIGSRLIGLGEPELLTGSSVPPSFFRVFAAPVLGRVYNESETDAALISHDLWVRKFGADPHVVGRTLPLDNDPLHIVGVMPAGFEMPLRRDYWRAPQPDPVELAQHGAGFLELTARLARDVTLQQAQAHADAVMQQLRAQFPKEYGSLRFMVMPLNRAMAYDLDELLFLLFGAVTLLLLIASTNTATLLLVRTYARERELAVRSALGASRVVLIRGRLLEAALLGLPALVIGITQAHGFLAVLLHLVPPSFPRVGDTRIDGAVLGASTLIGAAAVLLSAVLPALSSLRLNVAEILSRAGGGQASRRGSVMMHGLVAAQIAMCIALLAAAGVMMLGLYRLTSTPTGLRTTRFLTARVSTGSRYANESARALFWRRLYDETRSLAGVQRVTMSTVAPVTGGPNSGVLQLAGVGPPIRDAAPLEILVSNARWRSVLPSYFEALGITIVRGRSFTDADGPGAPLAVVVNDAAAKALFHGIDPLGRAVNLQMSGRRADGVVVGIGADVRETLAREARPEFFVSSMQRPTPLATLMLVTSRSAASITAELKAAVWRVDPTTVISDVQTFEQILERQSASARLRGYVFAAFAVTGLVLAMVAVASVVAYLVVRRTREIGIRRAVGARTNHILWLFARQTGASVAAGVGVGLILAWNLSSLLAGWTTRVSPREPRVYAAITALVILTATAAILVAARRAIRIDPATTLRAE